MQKPDKPIPYTFQLDGVSSYLIATIKLRAPLLINIHIAINKPDKLEVIILLMLNIYMPKKLIKKFMPDPEKLKEQKSLQFLGDRIHEPNLWHLNRKSVSLAFAIGLFAAWIPTPGQMVIAAAAAFYFKS